MHLANLCFVKGLLKLKIPTLVCTNWLSIGSDKQIDFPEAAIGCIQRKNNQMKVVQKAVLKFLKKLMLKDVNHKIS